MSDLGITLPSGPEVKPEWIADWKNDSAAAAAADVLIPIPQSGEAAAAAAAVFPARAHLL